MSPAESVNTHVLWRDNATIHGAAVRNDATVAPSPNNTKSDGNAQHKSVPNDVNSDK